MITKESAAKLVDFAKAVQKFAKAGDKEEQNAVDRENSRRAWVLLKVLKDCCEHLEQADLYDTLSDMPAKTPKDRARCAQIAKNENFDLMLAMREFERQLKEFDATPARKTVKLPDDAVLPASIAKKAVVKKPVAKKAAAKKSVAKKTVAKRTTLKKAA